MSNESGGTIEVGPRSRCAIHQQAIALVGKLHVPVSPRLWAIINSGREKRVTEQLQRLSTSRADDLDEVYHLARNEFLDFLEAHDWGTRSGLATSCVTPQSTSEKHPSSQGGPSTMPDNTLHPRQERLLHCFVGLLLPQLRLADQLNMHALNVGRERQTLVALLVLLKLQSTKWIHCEMTAEKDFRKQALEDEQAKAANNTDDADIKASWVRHSGKQYGRFLNKFMQLVVSEEHGWMAKSHSRSNSHSSTGSGRSRGILVQGSAASKKAHAKKEEEAAQNMTDN
eukprot:GSA25T00021434001.1